MTIREMDAKIEAWTGLYFPRRFPECLNAMASALAVVRERGLEHSFLTELNWVICQNTIRSDISQGWHLATASAVQQAEALVRMIEQEGVR